MPSLWYEGFGLIAMEAMLRGLPVVSSDSGGLVEAKQGTGFVIPVGPIEQYEAVFDENFMPKPVDSEQDMGMGRSPAKATCQPGYVRGGGCPAPAPPLCILCGASMQQISKLCCSR